MIRSDILKEIKRIARKAIPKGGQLILYGSQARNEATEDSDWDLLILLDKSEIEQSDYRNVLYPFAALGWNVGEAISPVMYTCTQRTNGRTILLPHFTRMLNKTE